MNKEEIKIFCKKIGITEEQFYGKETVGGGLYLRSEIRYIGKEVNIPKIPKPNLE